MSKTTHIKKVKPVKTETPALTMDSGSGGGCIPVK